jgi:hypothetical protein
MFFSFNSCFIHLLLNSPPPSVLIFFTFTFDKIKTPGIYKIKKWLQNQDDYSLQRPIRRQFKRARVVVSSFDEQLDVDLLDMQSLAKYNDNVKYLLVTIDVFSRYVRVRPLKNKTAKGKQLVVISWCKPSRQVY